PPGGRAPARPHRGHSRPHRGRAPASPRRHGRERGRRGGQCRPERRRRPGDAQGARGRRRALPLRGHAVTETTIRFRDDPWPRLRWLVPAAPGLTLLSPMAFLSLLRQPASPPNVRRPVAFHFIELPAPTPPAAAPPAPPERRSPPPRRLDVTPPRPVPAPSEP